MINYYWFTSHSRKVSSTRLAAIAEDHRVVAVIRACRNGHGAVVATNGYSWMISGTRSLLIVTDCTIAVAFYTTVPLFSTIVYIQQTHIFLDLIYTPYKTPFIYQMTSRMNIHSLYHFSTCGYGTSELPIYFSFGLLQKPDDILKHPLGALSLVIVSKCHRISIANQKKNIR